MPQEQNGEYKEALLKRFRRLPRDKQRFFLKIVKSLAIATRSGDAKEIGKAKQQIERLIENQEF